MFKPDIHKSKAVMKTPDFMKMYLRLFNYVTDAISLLQEAQQNAEETYMNGPDIQPQQED